MNSTWAEVVYSLGVVFSCFVVMGVGALAVWVVVDWVGRWGDE